MSLLFWRKKSKKRSYSTSARLSRVLGSASRKESQIEKEKESGTFTKWKNAQNWPIIRINAVIIFFCAVWVLLWGRAWFLQMVEGPRLADRAKKQHMATELVSGKRGLIYDRNGQVLARSVEARSVYAKPAEITDLPRVVETLAPLLDMKAEKLLKSLSGDNKKFVWLKRKIDDNTAELVRKANLSGVGLTREYERFYPFKHMAGQLLGFVGMDDKGLEGLERSLEERLGVMPVRQIVQRDAMGRKFYMHEAGQGEPTGEDVTLTLDMNIQFIAEQAIAKTVKEFDARWGGAIVVDIPTGDILAWAQYPFFNPNNYREVTPQIYRNRLAADALEPGSTFKPFVMAAALQDKKITPNTLIDCEGGKWKYKNYTIRDTSIRGILPASKVMRYSSNIGMAKIGQTLGVRPFHKYLQSLGFGDSINIPIANSKGILRSPREWGEVNLMATSFGQSISVTGLQMAQAYLTFLNGGVYKPLRLLNEDSGVEEKERRVFTEQSVRQVMDMMRDVVEETDGTGKRAKIPGIETAGKTGTAQKADLRTKTYGEKRLASFAGFIPARDPRFFILVLVDEPTRNPYGGVVAAPVFKEIASRVLTQSGILNEKVVVSGDQDKKKRQRGLKLAANAPLPWEAKNGQKSEQFLPMTAQKGMQLPGHLAKASTKVPDVMGKSVRNAVELFARAGVVPELKGNGSRVVRQSPPAGSPWPAKEQKTNYILWLSER